MIRLAGLVAILLVLAAVPLTGDTTGVRVGSKKFTESVVLGEITRMLIADTGIEVVHVRELGGTTLVFTALQQGDIVVYPEYTGTIAEELYSGRNLSWEEIVRDLRRQGIGVSRPLGFNNTYALGMLQSRAAELGIKSISDLQRHPDLVVGLSNEFMERADGWRPLVESYQLPQTNVSGMEQELAYRQLANRTIDIIDAYSTDAKIEQYDVAVLEDDLQHFPVYDAVLLYRSDFAQQFPKAMESLLRLEGSIAASEMVDLNAKVEIQGATESAVASQWLNSQWEVSVITAEPSAFQRIGQRTLEHADLVRRSLIPAILCAIPLGIAAVKFKIFGQVLLAGVGIVQTIPSLALLVMLMPVVAALGLSQIGVGSATAVVALFLYSLLPIVRATHAGLTSIEGQYLETARALGLPAATRMLQIELPLAWPGVLGGIKTAAILNVGFATLGALVGAGGYGQTIVSGIRLNDTRLVLEGAIPAALMAIAVQLGFEGWQGWKQRR